MNKTGSARSARTAVLCGLAGFVLLQVALAAITASTSAEYYDPQYGIRLHRLQQAVARSAKPRTLLLLGSSRVHSGIRPDVVARELAGISNGPTIVFNFGLPGGGPVGELLTLRRLLRAGLRPEYVVIEILPPLLNGRDRLPLEAPWLPREGLTLREILELERYGFSPVEAAERWLPARLVPWYGARFPLLGRMLPVLVPPRSRRRDEHEMDALGFVAISGSHIDLGERTIAARQEFGSLADFTLGEMPTLAARDLLDLCRREHISAALVLMPEGPRFRRLYPPAVWHQIELFLAALTAEYSVPIVNAREWIGEGDFVDSHHLLASGAGAFSARLAREKLAPWIGELSAPAPGASRE